MMAISMDCAALRSRSRVLAIVPLFHANSWGLVFAAPMMGACLVLPGAGLCPAGLCSGLLPWACLMTALDRLMLGIMLCSKHGMNDAASVRGGSAMRIWALL